MVPHPAFAGFDDSLDAVPQIVKQSLVSRADFIFITILLKASFRRVVIITKNLLAEVDCFLLDPGSCGGGDKGNRTPDLVTASHAL